MTGITRPDPQTLFDQQVDQVSNTILGGATVIPESNEWFLASLMYAQAESWYAIADQYRRETDPRTACQDNLVTMAAQDGVFPLPAQSAQGFVKVIGTAGTVLPVPLTFTASGQQFTTATDATQPEAIETNGESVVRVSAVIPGEAGNIAAGTIIALDTAVAGVTAVEICGAFCDGAAAETLTAFRSRYLARLQFTPRSTDDFVKARLLDWPCVTRVFNRTANCCVNATSGCDCRQGETCVEFGTDPTMGTVSTFSDQDCSCCGGDIGSCGCSDGCDELVWNFNADFTSGTFERYTSGRECDCSDCGGQLHYYVLFDDTFPDGIAPCSVLNEIQTWMFGDPQGYGLGQVEIGVCGRIVGMCPVPTDVVIDLPDCPTQAEVNAVRTAVEEFFTTIEPSRAINADDIRLTIDRLIAGLSQFTVDFQPVNAEQFYGGVYGPNSDRAMVYWSPCGIEPDCDVLVTLNSVVITTGANIL